MKSEIPKNNPIDDGLLSMLACPRCKGKLKYDLHEPALECDACCLRYPIREGIPILLTDQAEKRRCKH